MDKLIQFLSKAKGSFLAVDYVEKELMAAGFHKIALEEQWQCYAGGKYIVTIGDTACVAFTLPQKSPEKNPFFRIIAAHTDQPCLRIKPQGGMRENGYYKLNAEVYGGPIYNTWLDRPLSLAGQVVLRGEDVFSPRKVLVDLEEPVLVIPNLAIHMNREVNKGTALNEQSDMLPIGALLGEWDGEPLQDAVAKALQVSREEILDMDLYTYVTEKPELVGFNKEFLSSPRLDDLVMVYAGAEALMASEGKESVNMLYLCDHEEVGSTSARGADSTTLLHVMERIAEAMGQDRGQFLRKLPGSFVISADVAHAVHPAQPQKHDPVLKTRLGAGPVIKISAKQRYITAGSDYTVFEQICNRVAVPVQKSVNRSDQPGGSTIGPVLSSHLGCRGMDMGIALLAMHSARELMAAIDYEYTKKAFCEFFNV